VAEAACKTLVSQRLERPGMRWYQAGGLAIVTFRTLFQSRANKPLQSQKNV
jgi:hypothetical protein